MSMNLILISAIETEIWEPEKSLTNRKSDVTNFPYRAPDKAPHPLPRKRSHGIAIALGRSAGVFHR